MKYERFEQLPVWQAASDLAVRVFALGQSTALRRYRALRDQIERAAVSVSNNIAEGFERGSTIRASVVLVHCSRFGGRSSVHAVRDGTHDGVF